MVAAGFNGFLTVDRSLPFQQNLQASGIGVVLIVAKTNRVKELRRLMPAALEALGRIKPGELITVGA